MHAPGSFSARGGAAEQRANGDLAFTLAVVLVALLPRLFVAIAWAREPVWDGFYYHFYAERIADGLGYSEDVDLGGRLIWKPASHYPVGYSALLALFYRVFGSSVVVAPIVNALVGTALVAIVHRLARYYLGQSRARVAAAIAALHPGLIAYSAVVMTELTAALCLTGAALVAVKWRRRWLGALLAGGVVGLAVLIRPSLLLAAPLVALTQPTPVWKSALRGAAATGIALLVALPWSLRICSVMDGCAFVSTNGGWNLAIGALTESGRFRTLTAADGCPIVTGQVAQDRCWAKVGRAAIAKDPGRWLAMMPKKLGQTFDHESFPIEYLREADPRSWSEERRVAGRGLLTLFHRLLLIAAALGAIAAVSRSQHPKREWMAQTLALASVAALGLWGFVDIDHPFYPLAVLPVLLAVLPLPGRPAQGPAGRMLLGLLAATALTHALFFGDDRYHLVVTPALCLLAAAALRHPREPAERTPVVRSR
jgi:4-amino-4-deoxy-L-arabinose transferase-like glycosyltransferase